MGTATTQSKLKLAANWGGAFLAVLTALSAAPALDIAHIAVIIGAALVSAFGGHVSAAAQ